MSTIWSKFTGTIGKKTATPAEEVQKSPRRYTVPSLKSRKSLTETLLSTAKRHSLSTPDPALLPGRDVTCVEAPLYSEYDPANPDHNPSCKPADESKETRSPRHTWSASRLTDSVRSRYRSRSRSRSPSPTKNKAGLQDAAGTLKTMASFFYKNPDPSNTEGSECEHVSPAKSIQSKKSVRFRSGHTVIKNGMEQSEPIPIPAKSAPTLPQIEIGGGFALGDEITDHEAVGFSARPPDTPMLATTRNTSLSAREGLRPVLDDLTNSRTTATSTYFDDEPAEEEQEKFPDLPTPLPGTGTHMEDPFDDAGELTEENSDALHAWADDFKDGRKLSGTSVQAVRDNNTVLNGATSQTQSEKDTDPFDDFFSNDQSFAPDEESDDLSAQEQGYAPGDECDADTGQTPFYTDAHAPSKAAKPGAAFFQELSTSRTTYEDAKDSDRLAVGTGDTPLSEIIFRLRLPSDKYDADTENCDVDTTGVNLAIQEAATAHKPPQEKAASTTSEDGLTQGAGVLDTTIPSPQSDPESSISSHTYTRDKMGMLVAPQDVESNFSLGSAYSTDVLEPVCGEETTQPQTGTSLQSGIVVSVTNKENWQDHGSRHTSLVDPIKNTNYEIMTTRTLPSPDRKATLPEDCVSPLNLAPTARSLSPARRAPPFRYTSSTDEIGDTEAMDNTAFSLYARDAAEGLRYQNSDNTLNRIKQDVAEANLLPGINVSPGTKVSAPRSWVQERRTPSPAAIPLPQTALPFRTKASEFVQPIITSEAITWSAFDEARFAILAYLILKKHPDDFRQMLLKEGLSKRFWKELDLADSLAPPDEMIKFSESDVEELCSKIAAIGESILAKNRNAPTFSRRQRELISELKHQPTLQSALDSRPYRDRANAYPLSSGQEEVKHVSPSVISTDRKLSFSVDLDEAVGPTYFHRREHSGEISTEPSILSVDGSPRVVSKTSSVINTSEAVGENPDSAVSQVSFQLAQSGARAGVRQEPEPQEGMAASGNGRSTSKLRPDALPFQPHANWVPITTRQLQHFTSPWSNDQPSSEHYEWKISSAAQSRVVGLTYEEPEPRTVQASDSTSAGPLSMSSWSAEGSRATAGSSEAYGTGSHDQLPLVQHDFLSGFRKTSSRAASSRSASPASPVQSSPTRGRSSIRH